MPKVEIKNVSASKIKLYKLCPKQYYYAYGEGIFQEETKALSFGKYIHSVLELYVKHLIKKNTDQDMEALYSISEKIKKDFPLLEETGKLSFFDSDILINKFASVKIDPQKIYAVEKFFDLEIFDLGINLVGRIDRIDLLKTADKTGVLHIIDYKTGRNKVDADNLESDVQLLFYIVSVYHLYRKRYRDFKFSFHYLLDGDILDFETEFKDSYQDKIYSFVREIINDDIFEKKPGNLCRSCPAFKLCKPDLKNLEDG